MCNGFTIFKGFFRNDTQSPWYASLCFIVIYVKILADKVDEVDGILYIFTQNKKHLELKKRSCNHPNASAV